MTPSTVKKVFLGGYFLFSFALGTLVATVLPSLRLVSHNIHLYFLFVALAILGASMIKDKAFETTALRSIRSLEEVSRKQWEEARSWITSNLTPMLLPLDSEQAVLQQAAGLLSDLLGQHDPARQFLLFFGSASLYKETGPGTEPETANAKSAYQSALTQLTTGHTRMERYISLLTPADFSRRGPQTKQSYLSWLDRQAILLDRNPNYDLYDCPRAPAWGSSRSTIITWRGLLDIVGEGRSGYLIRGEQIAATMAKASRRLLQAAAVPPHRLSGADLQNYRLRLTPQPEA